MPKRPGEPTEQRDNEPELPQGMDWGWFCGEGSPKTGEIMRVIFSAELYKTDGGRFGRDIEEWKHYIGNRRVKDSSGIEDTGLKKMLQEIEKYILQTTGFTPRQLLDQAGTLAAYYNGQRQAPFKVESSLTPEEIEEEGIKQKENLLQELVSLEGLPIPLSWFVIIVKDEIVIDVDYSDEFIEIIGKENLEQAISVAMQSSAGLSREELRIYNRRLEPVDKLFKEKLGFIFPDLIVKKESIKRILEGKAVDLLPEGMTVTTEN